MLLFCLFSTVFRSQWGHINYVFVRHDSAKLMRAWLCAHCSVRCSLKTAENMLKNKL